MSVTVVWDNNEKTNILLSYQGEWNETAYTAGQQQVKTMMESSTNKVNLIISIDYNVKVPANAASRFRNAARNPHANSGMVVLVGMNPFVRAIASIVMKLTGSQRMFMVSTVDAARKLVETTQKPFEK